MEEGLYCTVSSRLAGDAADAAAWLPPASAAPAWLAICAVERLPAALAAAPDAADCVFERMISFAFWTLP